MSALTSIHIEEPGGSRRGNMNVDRNVHCLMGLPIDAVTMDEAVQQVRRAAFGNQRCFISTPNLNFVMAARADQEFRDSVLRSDLSLADGMPLVWVARLLGVPVRERVSGAGLFEKLLAHPGQPVTVFFFGGPDGAAEAACEHVNRLGAGLRCVGFDAPGFGSVEDMSSPALIDKINRSGAMFVIVSLGAKKGQRWIEHNRDRLQAPVLCHLGAVVNFAAGTVRRAPGWVQAIGAEWVWRIAQEPGLWTRYRSDGLAFIKVLAREVLPLVLQRRFGTAGHAPSLRVLASPGGTTLSLAGDWESEGLESLRRAINAANAANGLDGALTIDLMQTTRLGSAPLGLLMLTAAAYGGIGRFQICNPSRDVARTLSRSGASYLLASSFRQA